MSVFTMLTFVGGLGAVGSFILGVRTMMRSGLAHPHCGRACWTWRSVFAFFVFVTILAAPLSR